jgi:hypothetical protein
LTASHGSQDGGRRRRRVFLRLMTAVSAAGFGGLALTLVVGYAAAMPESAGRAGADNTVVRCNPAVVTATVRSRANLEIYVENVVDLYGADVRLSFDPAFAQVADADPVASGVQIEILRDFLKPDFVVRKSADNISGAIWYAATQVSPTLPVSGSGAVARVTFLPQTTGTFTMSFTYQELARRTGAQIPATAQDCVITFVKGRERYLPLIFRTQPGQRFRALAGGGEGAVLVSPPVGFLMMGV